MTKPTMPTPDDFRVAALYDPDADGAHDRLQLLRWLADLGFTIDEMRSAVSNGALTSLASDRRLVPEPRLQRADALSRSGLTPDAFDAYVTALGLEPIGGSPPGEVGVTTAELEALVAMDALSEIFTRDEALALVRVVGAALSRIADAAVSVFLTDVESEHLTEGRGELELAETVYDAVGLVDGLGNRLDPILRRQMLQAAERTRATAIDETERFQYRYAIGFVDLVGYTSISQHMTARELAAFVGRFEATAHDVVAAAGARVAKLIGDEVMFVAVDAAAAVRAGRSLIATFSATGGGVLPRGGMAYGSVVLRGGDYYGSVVNLASRLTELAVPRELLVTEPLAEAAPGVPFERAGRRMVKGFDEPVVVRSLMG